MLKAKINIQSQEMYFQIGHKHRRQVEPNWMFSWPGRVDSFPQIFSEHFSEEHSENATGRDYEAVSKCCARAKGANV